MTSLENKMMVEPLESSQPSNIISQIFKSDIIGINELRVSGTYESPLFVAKDIATILGYKNTNDTIKTHVDEEDKTIFNQADKNRGSETIPLKLQDGTILINESGLYSLILRSKMEKAKQFKRWVTSEVLPSIRKTGQFKLEQLEIQLQQSHLQLQQETKEKNRILKLHNQMTRKHHYYKFNMKGPVFYIIENGHEYKDDKQRPKFGIAGCPQSKHKNCPNCNFVSCDKKESESLDSRLRQHRVTLPHLQVRFAVYTPDALLLENCIKRVFNTEINPSGHEIIDDVSPQDVIIEVMKFLKMFNIRNKEHNYKIADDIEEYNINTITHSKEPMEEDEEIEYEIENSDDEVVINKVEEVIEEEVENEIENEIENEVEDEFESEVVEDEFESEVVEDEIGEGEYKVENEYIPTEQDIQLEQRKQQILKELDTYIIKKLNEILKEYNLSISGLKSDKVLRIKNHLTGNSNQKCINCDQTKPLSDFRKTPVLNILSKKCTDCEKSQCIKITTYKEETTSVITDQSKAKICATCKILKSFDDFYKHTGNKNGLETSCKICSCKQKSGKDKILAIKKAPTVPDGYKWCPKCTITKLVSDFCKAKNRDGYQHSCRSCYNIIRKNNRLKAKI